MNINLMDLNFKDKIEINEVVSYDKDYLKNSDIKALDNLEVNGEIIKDYEKRRD